MARLERGEEEVVVAHLGEGEGEGEGELGLGWSEERRRWRWRTKARPVSLNCCPLVETYRGVVAGGESQ